MRKQSITDNRTWLDALERCTEVWPKSDVKRMTDAVIGDVRERSEMYGSAVYGWCAGKDSIVLEDIIRKSRIDCKPRMWRDINEWPSMKEWVDRNAPKGIKYHIIDRFTFDYLNAHPKLLFCQDGTRIEWMREKWAHMKRDLVGCDLFITGCRLQDGNMCGHNGVVRGQRYDTYNPLYDWPHELILAYIRHNKIELPPFYGYPRGFMCGSVAMGEWTEYPALGLTEKEVFDEIWDIDPDIIINASGLDAAKRYMENRR